jgi:hypothetical protein
VSTSDAGTDFDRWIAGEYAAGTPRGFTALVILVKIGKRDVKPLCSTFVHVIGDELDWGEMTTLLAGAGMRWDGAAFFPRRDARDQGPLDTPAARLLLLAQEDRVKADAAAINEGHFFDRWGRRMKVEEA